MKKYSSALVLACICAGFFVTGVVMRGKFSSEKERLLCKIKQMDEYMTVSEEMGRIEKEYKGITDSLFDDFFHFKKVIEGAANSEGVRIDSLRNVAKSEEGILTEIKVSLALRCSYMRLVRFLDVIERNPIFAVKKMNIKRWEGDDLRVLVEIAGLIRKEK